VVGTLKVSSEQSELFNLLIECVKDKLLTDKTKEITNTRQKDSSIRRIANRTTQGKKPALQRDSYSSSPRLSEPTFR
jgi:hypothetical protein